MPGSIAKNAQEGTRSEYLAQYALSAFGTAIPVPHPEDSGIDLYCTLGKWIGRRFLVENHYLVQVKSAADPITYKDAEEVGWLLAHKYPLLICVINKKAARIELYQTIALSTISSKKSIKSVKLYPSINKTEDYFPTVLDEEIVEIFLGEPIVRFSVQNFDSITFRRRTTETIESWIKLDQENIDLKSTGINLYRIPEKWDTNSPVLAKKFVGNFKDSQAIPSEKLKFNDLFLKFLAQLVNQTAAEQNIEKYNQLKSYIKSYTEQMEIADCFGVRILQFCIEKGNERF